ncbi:MAG TPA: hypothetical protein VKQ32_11525 [Polyangia bacterium]|nr:hypothetical protein [Polyangia bacterium]
MGLMTELFISTPERAATYAGDARAQFERVQLGGLTNLEFETLWAILAGEAWDPDKHALREVTSTDSQWVFEFPAPYLAIIRSLSEEAKKSAAVAWADTEELAGSSPAELSAVIDQLVAASQSAANAGQRLFVWVSL